MKCRVWIISAAAWTTLQPSSCFGWMAVPRGSTSLRTLATIPGRSSASLVRLHQTNSSLMEENDPQQQQDLELQRQTATKVLDQISALKTVVLSEDDTTTNTPEASRGSYQDQVDQLEVQVQEMESDLIPPMGLTMEEYQSTMILFLQLPFSVRCAFCEALELDDPAKAATDLKRVAEIVTLLYQQRIQLTPQRLQDSLKTVKQRMEQASLSASSSGTPQELKFGNSRISVTIVNEDNSTIISDVTTTPPKQTVTDLLRLFDDSADNDNKSDEELQRDNTVKNIMGRVTRKEGITATKADLDRLLKVLDKETFVVASTETIPGGYVIRGKKNSKLTTGTELIQAIDTKLPPTEDGYPASVCLMNDITSADVVGAELIGDKPDPVLVLLNKDYTPEVSGVLTTLSSTIAIMAAFVFCVSVYGQNDIVASRLSDATAVNDADGVTWFTSKVYDVLVPILVLQALHETGHFALAKINKFDMALPTVIPFYGLPFMGTKTDLISPPPSRNALFDFAFVGPFLGLVASLACFAYGLELTANADAFTTQFFPALPVDLIQKSTLGGSMIDYFLGGGMVGYDNRFITMQEPNTPVTLHPLAIAGFTSLIMNALALLPLGSTDGGRLSQAMFGRYGHITISSFVWIALLITTFTVQQSDIIIGAWAINNIIQNDCEIPCRDETEDVSFPRVMAAITVWFVTFLALTPL